jgi:hypothetical protein
MIFNAQPSLSQTRMYCLLTHFMVSSVYLRIIIHNFMQEVHSHMYFGLVGHLFHYNPLKKQSWGRSKRSWQPRYWTTLTNPTISVTLIQVHCNFTTKIWSCLIVLKEDPKLCLQKHNLHSIFIHSSGVQTTKVRSN